MIAYHVDRHNYLKPNMNIGLINDYGTCSYLKENCQQLYPEGLSIHGINYLMSDFAFQNPVNKTCTIYELVFEDVRRSLFQNQPSRFQSFFACKLEYLDKWISKYFTNPCPIYEIEFDKYTELDSSWFNDQIIKPKKSNGFIIEDWTNEMSIFKLKYQANMYWNSKLTDDPLMEFLVTSSFRVIRRVG